MLRMDMDQRSKPYFFAFWLKRKPNKVIADCVRVETIEIEAVEPFDQTRFTLFPADVESDTRLQMLIESAHGFYENNRELMERLKLERGA